MTGVMEGVEEVKGEVEAPQVDDLGRSYATGRRKEASARVWVKRGVGAILVNGKRHDEKFVRETHSRLAASPMEDAGVRDRYDVVSTVKGGGLSGQAGALRHGIAHALLRMDPSLRGLLRSGGHLTRDARVVERKKYGRPKARRGFQFSKR